MWRKPAIWILFVGLGFLLYSAYLQSAEPKSITEKRKQIIRNVENEIQILNVALTSRESALYTADEETFLKICDSFKLYAVRYNKGLPQVWNTQDFQFQANADPSFQVIEQNGVYLAVWYRKQGDQSLVIAYNIFDLSFPEIKSEKVV